MIFDGFTFDDTVFNLSKMWIFGQNIDLSIFGDGTFVIGGAVETVPEPSTWTMMAIGFAGLGVMGWRGSRKTAARIA
ncbi:MAG TPA: PEP-CTERM sorting domain-containing protein [Roseiarcus sp.]